MPLPVVGLVLGDCTGIGPEQCARVLHGGRMAAIARLVVIGDARVLERGMEHAKVRFAYARVASPRKRFAWGSSMNS